jgi:hypothetical protein
MTTCVNLAARFGNRCKIAFEEKYNPGKRALEQLDPWMMEIPCRRGTIYPYGGNLLAVMIDGHPKLVRELRGLPFLKIVQDGDQEATFVFDVADFDKIAKLVKPRRRRRLTESQRRAAAVRLAPYAF